MWDKEEAQSPIPQASKHQECITKRGTEAWRQTFSEAQTHREDLKVRVKKNVEKNFLASEHSPETQDNALRNLETGGALNITTATTKPNEQQSQFHS